MLTRGNKSDWLSEFDAEEIRRIHESGAAKSVKREWITSGYDQQMSLYGVVYDASTDEAGYKRIEILSDTLFDSRIVALIFEFFQYFKPESPYTIWIYSKERDSIKQAGAYK